MLALKSTGGESGGGFCWAMAGSGVLPVEVWAGEISGVGGEQVVKITMPKSKTRISGVESVVCFILVASVQKLQGRRLALHVERSTSEPLLFMTSI
jgi:hypothetical protein